MTAGRDNESSTLTRAAIRRLERLAQQRYGRDARSLDWSVTQELRNAGFVSGPVQGWGGVSITRAGQDSCVQERGFRVPPLRCCRLSGHPMAKHG
ncbi:hypothetical protein P3T23_002056 [Paraburkholderia sp. GAS448]|uniref:hypothetical protein n=1 Tax=Paraburkholderia sp. GAS448 TaxID=3035136 RepID=UPI003D2543CC